MFHVEHAFLETWRRYSKILKQRNAALRRRQHDVLDSIDDVLSETGDRLGLLRKAHSSQVSKRIEDLLKELDSGLEDLRLEYLDGWKGQTLAESLAVDREKDMERGSTGQGPHRADLNLLCDKSPARSILSRGEQKILAAALLFAQVDILSEKGEKPVLLLDDLASEFDQNHFDVVMNRAIERSGQVWLSGTRLHDLGHPHSVFHVEHGLVREVV